jgi:hypothetical protein
MSVTLPNTAAPAATGLPAIIGAAIRDALQWRLLLLWAVLLVLPTLVATLPAWQMLGDTLDQSTQAATLAHALDLASVSDLMQVSKRYLPALGNGALVALVLTLFLSPLLSGMTIAAARAPQRLGLGGLLAGGMREYGRLLRMLIWAAVPLGIAFAAGSAVSNPLRSLGANAVLEATAQHASWTATAIVAILVLLADATVDAGRAVLAADRRKTSAVRAWGEGVMLVLRRPGATLGSYLAITLAGLVLAAVIGLVRVRVAPIEGVAFVGALALTQLAVMAVAWMRAARLFALIGLIGSVAPVAPVRR